MKTETIEKISKFLPLLASDQDGEVLAAARMLMKALQRDGADLHELVKRICAGGTSAAPLDVWEDLLRRTNEQVSREAEARAEAEERRKAEQEAYWADHWAREAAEAEKRFAEAVAQHGPDNEAFAETPDETRLALGPVAFPALIVEKVSEWQRWQDLGALRRRYDKYYEETELVSDRVAALEQHIVSTRALTWAELDARLSWIENSLSSGWLTMFADENAAHLRLLGEDLARLRQTPWSPRRRRGTVQNQTDLFERTTL
ncbi:hypothetical protein C8J38_11025 [Rhizobium sp. PP-WC-2G-219]|nr:hypothetical protein C8J38_11025 [Rhizobium sp. PP-WC-2G-219]